MILHSPSHIGDLLGALTDHWRKQAATLRAFKAEPQAAVLEKAAAELDDALRTQRDEPLTLPAAALECGYSAEHLGRLIRTGTLDNVGRKGSPRVRRGDLPRKASTPTRRDGLPAGFALRMVAGDKGQIARAVVHSDKEDRDG